MASLVIVLAVICLVMATLLGVVNSVTEAPIAANNAQTVLDSLAEVMPGVDCTEIEYSDESITIDGASGTTVLTVIGVYQAGDEGYVVEVSSPNGFGGALDMMTGIDADGAVTGIAIIDHSETSGLGSKSTDPNWQAQFKGQTDTVAVAKDGGDIEAITGSTITSRAVCDGVNAARAVVESLG
jgi:electron transport complex protein RnfG